MFILDLLYTIIVLTASGFGGLYLYQEKQRGWIGIKTFADDMQYRAKRLIGYRENPTERVQRIKELKAQELDHQLKAVAAIDATITQYIQQEQELEQQILMACELEEDAIKKGKHEELKSIVAEKIGCRESAIMLKEEIKKLKEVSREKHLSLSDLEREFRLFEIEAQRIVIEDTVSQANWELYKNTSYSVIGAGPSGRETLKQLAQSVEHSKLQSENLLTMIKDRERDLNLLTCKETNKFSLRLMLSMQDSPSRNQVPTARTLQIWMTT